MTQAGAGMLRSEQNGAPEPPLPMPRGCPRRRLPPGGPTCQVAGERRLPRAKLCARVAGAALGHLTLAGKPNQPGPFPPHPLPAFRTDFPGLHSLGSLSKGNFVSARCGAAALKGTRSAALAQVQTHRFALSPDARDDTQMGHRTHPHLHRAQNCRPSARTFTHPAPSHQCAGSSTHVGVYLCLCVPVSEVFAFVHTLCACKVLTDAHTERVATQTP